MRVTVLVWVLTVPVFLVGCGGGGGGGTPEASYQGKPTSAWVEQLQDKDPTTRDAALDALTAIGADDDRAVQALADYLVTTEDQRAMRKCAGALEDMEAAAKAVVPTLVAHLGDEAPRSGYVSQVLGAIKDESTLAALYQVIEGGDPNKARRAFDPAAVLAREMDRQAEAAPHLGKAFRSFGENPDVQAAAAIALCGLGPDADGELEKLLPDMGHLLDSPDRKIRASLSEAICVILDWKGPTDHDEAVINGAVDALAHVLDDRYLDDAASILRRITSYQQKRTYQQKRRTPGTELVPALIELLQRDTDAAVAEAWYDNRRLNLNPEAEVIELRMKARAADLLALLGPEAAAARPELEKWASLDDCPEGVQISKGRCEVADAARKALDAIPG